MLLRGHPQSSGVVRGSVWAGNPTSQLTGGAGGDGATEKEENGHHCPSLRFVGTRPGCSAGGSGKVQSIKVSIGTRPVSGCCSDYWQSMQCML